MPEAAPPSPDLSVEQIVRYARHIMLPEVGAEGQARLLAARILVVGAGGLGAPTLTYLAAAGVGTLGLLDADQVELSNLQRQIIHTTADLGRPKVLSAREKIAAINPDVTVEEQQTWLGPDNAAELVDRYDVIIDGTDNFEARYLLADACVLGGKPLVSAALLRFDGQVAAFSGAGKPCYRCAFPEPPPPGAIPSCADAGILGAVAGLAGSLQALEALKLVLGIGESPFGRLLMIDGLGLRFDPITLPPDPDCRLCGPAPEIVDLSAHRRAG